MFLGAHTLSNGQRSAIDKLIYRGASGQPTIVSFDGWSGYLNGRGYVDIGGVRLTDNFDYSTWNSSNADLRDAVLAYYKANPPGTEQFQAVTVSSVPAATVTSVAPTAVASNTTSAASAASTTSASSSSDDTSSSSDDTSSSSDGTVYKQVQIAAADDDDDDTTSTSQSTPSQASLSGWLIAGLALVFLGGRAKPLKGSKRF